MEKLKDRVAIVTGGSAGIGRAAVLKLADEGAKIAIWDIDEAQGQELANELSSRSIQAIFQKVNTADPEAVNSAAEEVIRQLGRIDILINNAGITRDATIKKMTNDQWDQVIAVNLTGVFNCIKAASPNMIENGSGRIINTSSVVGLAGNFGQTNYAATKAGVIGMTKTLARELGKYQITVNAVAPGFIATEMVKAMPEKVIEMMISKTPLGRLGTPEDIASAYVFLASDDASFITGTVISVDGAVTL
ncbi:MAG: 3-oxoacyl-ACP reductase FabG [Reichenbachiella sp.]|uniref:3-oxoacyl-ACP reductase FabG n=1 Tax=Reichenbachiella sp. TaxID=2184521 RepID=UPI003265278A